MLDNSAKIIQKHHLFFYESQQNIEIYKTIAGLFVGLYLSDKKSIFYIIFSCFFYEIKKTRKKMLIQFYFNSSARSFIQNVHLNEIMKRYVR